jgi:hypothetical protein
MVNQIRRERVIEGSLPDPLNIIFQLGRIKYFFSWAKVMPTNYPHGNIFSECWCGDSNDFAGLFDSKGHLCRVLYRRYIFFQTGSYYILYKRFGLFYTESNKLHLLCHICSMLIHSKCPVRKYRFLVNSGKWK